MNLIKFFAYTFAKIPVLLKFNIQIYKKKNTFPPNSDIAYFNFIPKKTSNEIFYSGYYLFTRNSKWSTSNIVIVPTNGGYLKLNV